MSESIDVAEHIWKLPPTERLRLAAKLLDEAKAKGGDLAITRMAQSIASRTAAELGDAIQLYEARILRGHSG